MVSIEHPGKSVLFFGIWGIYTMNLYKDLTWRSMLLDKFPVLVVGAVVFWLLGFLYQHSCIIINNANTFSIKTIANTTPLPSLHCPYLLTFSASPAWTSPLFICLHVHVNEELKWMGVASNLLADPVHHVNMSSTKTMLPSFPSLRCLCSSRELCWMVMVCWD